MVKWALHKFGYTEESLQTRLIEDIQDSYEKLSSSTSDIETKINNNTNEIKNISLQLESIKNELINLEEKNQTSRMKNEILLASQIKKEIIQLLYDKGLFDNYKNKDQIFEKYLIFTDEYLLNKYGKEIKIGQDVNIIYQI